MLRDWVWGFLAVLAAISFFPGWLRAQQMEIPPLPGGAAGTIDPASAPRIVEGPPGHYGLKRNLHPAAWAGAAISPLLKLFEKVVPVDTFRKPRLAKPPRESGVKFGVGGQGSGTGIGPVVQPFHNNLFGSGAGIEVPLSLTYKVYEAFGVRTGISLWRGPNSDGLSAIGLGAYASRPSDNFFGIGNDTSSSDEAHFRTVTRSVAGALEGRLAARWTVRLEEGYRSLGITKPRESPSIARIFPGQDIPGETEGATMLATTAYIGRNTRDRPVLPASGGLQRVAVSLNEGLAGGDFSYWRYRGEIQQFVPVSADRRNVLIVRAGLESTQAKGGSVVPFYDLPTVGGYATLRGFDSRRFTDNSALAVSFDYRYRIWPYIDWGLFADFAQVAPQIGDFALKAFHAGYGARVIGRSQAAQAVSLDIAFSRERRWVLYLQFNPGF
ncbi:MAG TPA: BamA/TamA family outer membrane protein [Terriglobia bacterium]|nr:BamA/TamA family outer membrane protein [Terriglobia bacterium]